jgi:uncharacterized membrane protein
MNKQLINTVISTNDFFGIEYSYRHYDIIKPVEHQYNGYFRLKGMIGYVIVQAFQLGSKNRLAWAVQFIGVPGIKDGYYRFFSQDEERQLYNMLYLEERCAI